MEASGVEWIVDARGCDASKLQSQRTLQQLFDHIVTELGLHPIGLAAWHQFPHTFGLTGMWMLSESHLTCHTFPEFNSLCINLFCCRPRPTLAWADRLRDLLAAADVRVRVVERNYGVER